VKKPMCLWIENVTTPVGPLAVVFDEEGRLHALGWTDGHARMDRQLRAYAGAQDLRLVPASTADGPAAALRAYFSGDVAAIDGLPVTLHGTEFQRAVWGALRDIPCGETSSYGAIARRIGRPLAVRAVGLASGANPVGIVLPCHRVVGSDGSLTGYGGGIERKRWLLSHEARACDRSGGAAVAFG
jgi:methylated-DNA-[protein]-cysteine S-methyltransferase